MALGLRRVEGFAFAGLGRKVWDVKVQDGSGNETWNGNSHYVGYIM